MREWEGKGKDCINCMDSAGLALSLRIWEGCGEAFGFWRSVLRGLFIFLLDT